MSSIDVRGCELRVGRIELGSTEILRHVCFELGSFTFLIAETAFSFSKGPSQSLMVENT